MNYIKPDSINEATIQAELYTACWEAGLVCDLQYSISLGHGGRDIPDLVIVEGNQIISIVEIKSYISFNNLTSTSEDQIKRYKKHNVPVFILYSLYDIPHLVNRLVGVKKKYVETLDSATIKCFEGDKQSENRWDEKISEAISKFDEAFPDYVFTNEHSLEMLAIGVKVLGLQDLLWMMDEYSTSTVGDFFFMLESEIAFKKAGPSRFILGRKNTVQTLTMHKNRLERIDEKLK